MVADSAVKAADLPKPAVAQSPQFDWSGWYVGGHVGYAAGGSDRSSSQPGVVSAGRTDLTNGFDLFKGTSSFFSGLQGGYNVVLPSRLMLGLEADVSFPNSIAGTSVGMSNAGIASYGDTVLSSGTMRGRLGYVLDNNWLVYGTGGFAWSYDQLTRTQVAGAML